MEAKFPKMNSGRTGISNKVQLSAYGNRIGKNLKDLAEFLDDKRLKNAIGGLHLLPVYPSSGDGGFAPLTYKDIDPEMGTWEDIKQFSDKYELMLEYMVNHISPSSDEFQDFLKKGDECETADMWIDWKKFWPKGKPDDEDLERIRTRKPEPPMIEVTLQDGSKRQLWCTFGPQQIDLDPFSSSGSKFVEESLRSLCARGAKLLRLDAFGYVTKKYGTPCFFEEPEVWDFLKGVDDLTNEYGTAILCEVHEQYKLNLALAAKGYYVYDFALPLLVLHAIHWKTALNLRSWMEICPHRQITVLDTHDGMGIDDITGLAELCDQEQLAEVVEHNLGCGANFKYHYRNGKYEGKPHQYNCTYFSALRKVPQDYLLARAIQFFTPGMPMIYYNGLLAGENDMKLMEETGNGRDINRHFYTVEEAKQALDKPVVKALLDLCRFRNNHPAFGGEISINEEQPDHYLDVSWKKDVHHARLVADMQTRIFHIYGTKTNGDGKMHCTQYDITETAEWESSDLDEDEQSSIGKDPKLGAKRHFNSKRVATNKPDPATKPHFADV